MPVFNVTTGGAATASIQINSGTGTIQDLFRDACLKWTTGAAGGTIVYDSASNQDYYCTSAHTSSGSNQPGTGGGTMWVAVGTHHADVPNWSSSSVSYGVAPIYRTGTSPNFVYAVQGNRWFSIENTANLTVTSGTTLQWTLSSNPASFQIYARAGSTFRMVSDDTNGSASLICNTAGASQSNCRLYLMGLVELLGTSTNKVIIEKFYIFDLVPSAASSGWEFDHVIIKNNIYTSSSGYMLRILRSSGYFLGTKCIIKNTKITQESGYENRSWGLTVEGDCQGDTLENIEIEKTMYPLRYMAPFAKFVDCSFHDNYYYAYSNSMQFGSASIFRMYNATANDFFARRKDVLFQPISIVYKNCLFYNNNTVSADKYCVMSFSAFEYYDNCTFGNASIQTTYGIYVYNGSVCLLNNPTFVNISLSSREIRKTANTNYLMVYPLDLTVVDDNGSPVSGAVVIIRQRQDKEEWMFKTNSQGKIRSAHEELPVFVNKELALSGDVTWSNSNDEYVSTNHEIIISKPGYRIWRQLAGFNQQHTITARLVHELSGQEVPVLF